LKETIMANTQAVLSADGPSLLSDADLDQVNGGFFIFIGLGVVLGITYCVADGTLLPPSTPSPKGDFPTGPKNMG
jgi:hypothetical protein